MPSYVGLEQTGFYRPFELLQQGLAQRANRKQRQSMFDAEHGEQKRMNDASLKDRQLDSDAKKFDLEEKKRAAVAREAATRFDPSAFTTEAIQPPGEIGPMPSVAPDLSKPFHGQSPDIQAKILADLTAKGISAPAAIELFNRTQSGMTGQPIVPVAPPGMELRGFEAGGAQFKRPISAPGGGGDSGQWVPSALNAEGEPTYRWQSKQAQDFRFATGPDGKPVPGFYIGPDGNPVQIPRSAGPTEAQAGAQMFSARMGHNNQIIEQLEKSGAFNPAAASTAPEIRVMGTTITRPFMGEPHKQYYDAKKNWIAAILRKESGAAISQAEYAEADEQYFPQRFDGPETMARKAELRRLAEDTMRSIGAVAGVPDAMSALQGGPKPVSPPLSVTRPESAAPTVQRFGSVQEAQAAGIPPGTRVEIWDPRRNKFMPGVWGDDGK